jgi:hypothetical protein
LETLGTTIISEKLPALQLCKSGQSSPEYTKKIFAGYLASAMMKLVKNPEDRERIARLQNILSSSNIIVTQFNSMIALENEQQKQDLEKYA